MKQRIKRRFEPWSDFELEAYLCGELAEVERVRLEQTAQNDPLLREYIEQRRATQHDFSVAHPLLLDSSRSGRDRLRGQRLYWPLAGGALALAAAALLLVRTGGEPGARLKPAAVSGDSAIRIKGGHSLQAVFYVKRGAQVFPFDPEVVLRPGDRLRLQVTSPSAGYLTLLARDGSGHVSSLYDRLAIQSGRSEVPDSLILDSQPGDEAWLLVLAKQPLPSSHYADAFAHGGMPDQPHLLFEIRKEVP